MCHGSFQRLPHLAREIERLKHPPELRQVTQRPSQLKVAFGIAVVAGDGLPGVRSGVGEVHLSFVATQRFGQQRLCAGDTVERA